MPLFLTSKFIFVVFKPPSTITNACRISLDTFSAKRAVSTRYIIPIIFCLGVSFPPDIIYIVFLKPFPSTPSQREQQTSQGFVNSFFLYCFFHSLLSFGKDKGGGIIIFS